MVWDEGVRLGEGSLFSVRTGLRFRSYRLAVSTCCSLLMEIQRNILHVRDDLVPSAYAPRMKVFNMFSRLANVTNYFVMKIFI